MNIKINSRALAKALSLAIKAIPGKSSLPILETFLLESRDNRLTITASDSSVTIVCTTDAECEGRMAVMARDFLNIVKVCPDIDITITTEDKEAVIDWGFGNSVIPTFPVEDYPVVAIPGAENSLIVIPQKVLRAAFDHTLPCVEKDDKLRPALTGILLDAQANKTNFVATDAKIMSVYPIPAGCSDPRQIIIPSSAAATINSALNKEGDVAILADEKNIAFCFGDVTISCRTLEGKFPKYSAVIPTGNSNVAIANRAVLMESVNRVSTCANKSTGAIRLTISQEIFKAEAQDFGFALAATETVPGVRYEGAPISIGFKSEVLMKALGIIGSKDVIVKLADERRAALLIPQDAEADPCTLLLMPILIGK